MEKELQLWSSRIFILEELIRLKEITAQLRSENGCNWDKKQTHESLITYLLEESYEVVDAIHRGDFLNLKEELGDLLFNVFFQAQIASENGKFTIEDVAKEVSDKLVRRHPHVFASVDNLEPEAIIQNWQKIKEEEKLAKGKKMESILDSVPSSLPSLIRAYKLQEAAAKVGFDWDDISGVIGKLKEELDELSVELEHFQKGEYNPEHLSDELGDVLFTVVNLSRFCKTSAEISLSSTCNKFKKRFQFIEVEAAKQGKNLKDMTLAEMDELWNQAKRKKNF